MKRWKVIAATVVLGLWAVCSTSCAFETFSLTKALVCCAEEKSASDPLPESDCSCSCGVLVSGIFLPHSELSAHDWSLDSCEPPLPAGSQPLPALLPFPEGSPPENARCWHFDLRAASQPRAPSAVS